MRVRASVLLAGLGLPCISPGAAGAAVLKDGVYQCTLGSAFLGDIELAGANYRGPAFDGNYEGSFPFSVSDKGTIDWKGPLGGLDSGGNTVVATVVTDTGGGRTGFDFTIQLPSGNFSTVNCSLR